MGEAVGSQTFGRIGDASVAHRIANEEDGDHPTVAHFPGGTLGPEAANWAHSLLAGARFELARADDKASTLFRFYGVVAALSIGLLAGRSWSPTDLQLGAEIVFWAGCATLLASGVFLGISLYPREVKGQSPGRLLYFGHVNAYESVGELLSALRLVENNSEERLAEQLLAVCGLVRTKYGLMRRALVALGVGTALCIVGVLVDALITHA